MQTPSVFLGLHVGHDRAVSVVQDGEITFHTPVERLDRRKHSDSPDLPLGAVRRVLDELSISISSIQGACVTYHGVEAHRTTPTFEGEFKSEFPEFRGGFATVDHHLAHALGAFACSPFQESLAFVADGAGDVRLWGSQAESLYFLSRNNFYLLKDRVQDRPLSFINRPEFYDPQFFTPVDQRRQISLGLKYEQLTYLCGFGPGQAGQTMALAAYGRPLFDVDAIAPSDFGFSLRYTDILDRITDLALKSGLTLRQFARESRADVAATAQSFIEAALVNLVDDIVSTYNPKSLCFAGGVFLNCLANRKIRDRHPGVEQFVLPACHDEGQSLGAVAYACWQATGKLPCVSSAFPYLGFEHSQDECERAFQEAGLSFERLATDELVARLADLLANGSICGVVRARSETGPRALGNRSILADPRSLNSKKRLDEGIKRRAEFRPYAPIVSLAHVNEYYDRGDPSPYMLLTATVSEEWRSKLAAVTSIDGSARLQTVGPNDNPFISELLTEFSRRTGVAALLNTSFNDEREPIVETPSDAIRTFLTTDLDVIVCGDAIHIRQES